MNKSLSQYILELQQLGRLSFTQKEARDELELSVDAIKLSANRLVKKKRLFMPRKGFYVIIPTTDQRRGFIDPMLYIHNLMKFLNANYYIKSLILPFCMKVDRCVLACCVAKTTTWANTHGKVYRKTYIR
jgi:hypothetical protein